MNKYIDLDFAKLDIDRIKRRGYCEAVFCECKSNEQLLNIFRSFKEAGSNVLGTRASKEQAQILMEKFADLVQYDETSKTLALIQNEIEKIGEIAICTAGTGDMSVAALLDLGADRELLDKALLSMKLDNEFKYNVTKQMVNAIAATDFEVILPHHTHHHHEHRNLDDVNKIIDRAEITLNAKELAKKIFKIVAEAESKVHNKGISQIHFHEIGAIDSIVDIISFAVLYDNLNPNKVYFSTLSEGQGSVMCQHGELSVPVPAVCEIVSRYQIPIRITDNQGEMITPTGAAIVAALFNEEKLPNEFIIEKVGYGRGKRPYKNPTLRVMKIKEKLCI